MEDAPGDKERQCSSSKVGKGIPIVEGDDIIVCSISIVSSPRSRPSVKETLAVPGKRIPCRCVPPLPPVTTKKREENIIARIASLSLYLFFSFSLFYE